MLQSAMFDIDLKVPDLDSLQPRKANETPKPLISKAVVIGNFPPRQCGMATFTHDVYTYLKDALPKAQIDVVAMNDVADGYDYPPEVRFQLTQNDRPAYFKLAERLKLEGYDAVFVQHEFGIYGGPSGTYLLDLLKPLTCPIVTTFHTVLECPNAEQRRVMEGLIMRSAGLITMAHKGAELLNRIYDVPQARISVIPHGAPTRPLSDTELFKARLNVSGYKTLTTFGLLSPNKGIETVIKALPEVKKTCEDVIYLIVGATHPHQLRDEGEAYRQSLIDLAKSLDVENNVMFINRFIDNESLFDILQASDIYVTPYLTETQITSGTLSYALALGRPVISTPYWHATEALAGGVGIICPFNDSKAFAAAITGLLSDDLRREAMSQLAYVSAYTSRWPSVARAYVQLSESHIRARKDEAKIHSETSLAMRNLLHRASVGMIEVMSDDTGMFQHSRLRIPDRRHGYCTDDTARALSLVARRTNAIGTSRRLLRHAYIYAAFVNDAWNEAEGRFRNFMSFSREWLDDGGSDDCCARALESLADVAASDLPEDLKLWAVELAQRVIPYSDHWTSTRSRAALTRILGKMIGVVSNPADLETAIAQHGEALMALYEQSATPQSPNLQGHWFEPQLSYDNARLSEGLLWAAEVTHNNTWLKAGLESLRWLMHQQTCGQKAHFRPIPTSRFCDQPDRDGLFDQQPLEALASIEACTKAYELTHEGHWLEEANKAFRWFEGANDCGVSLITSDGGCHDGLTREGVNQNQGAESILSYHLSLCALAGQ